MGTIGPARADSHNGTPFPHIHGPIIPFQGTALPYPQPGFPIDGTSIPRNGHHIARKALLDGRTKTLKVY